MEDKFDNATISLDITIPYDFHPEILIRLFREHILDTSFLHFMRILLHQKQNIDFSLPEFYFRETEFYNLLWNYQTHKMEYALIHIWKENYNFPSNLFWLSINQTDFVRKIKYISDSEQLSREPLDKIIEKTYLIHYARYRNTLIINTNGNLDLFVKNWNLFFSFFFEKYFHLWFEPHRIGIKDLSKNSGYFLGHLLYVKDKSTLFKIWLVNNWIDTNLITKEFCTIVPIVPLIRLLSKENFCDSSGRPICKISWTTLTDHEIFKRFDQIIKNIFSYYAGSVTKKGLYQLHYILRFSCAKTLACKHKSTIRTVWKKYGSNFFKNSVYLKNPHSISWRTYEKKFWYLNIVEISYLTHFSRKFRDVRQL
uniref:Maturase K n=1 Tax=Notoscyphus lutescens TaxID=399523 RepID=A0A8F2XW12_9MARC|nr:maturase K [Notoscyphus lutescens]